MKWKSRANGQRFIQSEEGYKISATTINLDKPNEKKLYAAWPPKNEGNLFNPPRPEGAYPKAILYTEDYYEAKHACQVHYCKEKEIEGPGEYIPKTEDNSETVVVEKSAAMPPTSFVPPDLSLLNEGKPEEKEVKQSNCKTKEDLINRLGYSEKRADHIIKGREQTKHYKKELDKYCQRARANNISGFEYTMREISQMKDKQLKQLISEVSQQLRLNNV